jgi:hypothetical protein
MREMLSKEALEPRRRQVIGETGVWWRYEIARSIGIAGAVPRPAVIRVRVITSETAAVAATTTPVTAPAASVCARYCRPECGDEREAEQGHCPKSA